MSLTKYCKIMMANLTPSFHVFQVPFLFKRSLMREHHLFDIAKSQNIILKNRVSLKENAALSVVSHRGECNPIF